MVSNLQLAKDLYAGFARGDIPTVLAGFQPAIEWREAEGNYVDTAQLQTVMAMR